MVADFIQRVSAYPVVNATWQRASGCYAWAKGSSAYARAAADITEDGLRLAARTAAPLLGRFEGGITSLDQLACSQLLDRLEAHCPAVKSPTEELVESGIGYYSTAVKPKVDLVISPVTTAVAKVQSAKAYGMAQYRRLSDSGLVLADWADRCVDRYLPAHEGAARNKAEEAADSLAEAEVGPGSGAGAGRSLGRVGRKLRRRLTTWAAAEAASVRQEFAARVEAAEADAEAATRLAAAARHAQAVSRAGVEVAASRLPALESLPLAGRIVDWLATSVYAREHFQFDLYDSENRRCLSLAMSAIQGRNGCRRGNDPRLAAAAAASDMMELPLYQEDEQPESESEEEQQLSDDLE